jgi:hypothetical protein
MIEFNVKYDLIFKTPLREKLGKEFRSSLKSEKGKLKGLVICGRRGMLLELQAS